MNCSPTIAIALLLLSLTAGMFLLYKTQKEILGRFFKIVSWFIIVVSIGCMIHCSVHCMFRCGMQRCGGMEQCGPGGDDGGDCRWEEGKHFNKRVMIYKEGGEECGGKAMGHGCCKEMTEECDDRMEGCEEGEMDCCSKGAPRKCGMEGEEKCEMKMKMHKDTVVVKKK